MKNINSTKKYLSIAIVVFVILIIATIFSLFVISNEKEKLRTISNELSIANKEDVVTLKRAIRNYEESAGSVDDFLVGKDEVFVFISDVEKIAKDSGVVITVQGVDLFDVLKTGELSQNIGQENPERTHGKFVMSIRVDGNWESVSKFLLKMENIPKHSIIESFGLTSIFDSQTKKQTWAGNFNIMTTTN